MKVKDIIAKLSGLDPNIDVVCYTEDEDLAGERKSAVFEIETVEVVSAEKHRDEKDVAGIRFDKSPRSTPHVLLYVTSDF